MIQPKPFTLKCPNCGWSKRIHPKSDVVDISWGIEYLKCPQCGTPTERTYGTDLLTDAIDTLKGIFGGKK